MNGNTVTKIESFLSRFVSFTDRRYAFVLALWTIATYVYKTFDAFPYLCITSDTKRSGKTRCAEMLAFVASNPIDTGAMTPAMIYRTIESESPTLFIDEAEDCSRETSPLRPVLNMGYRRGKTVIRMGKDGTPEEFQVYCPKVFILIGDLNDTLRDRCIIVRLVRAESRERFVYESVQTEGEALRTEIKALATKYGRDIEYRFANYNDIAFLTDRDAEIWTALFVVCSVLCHERIEELSRYAVDIATEKTMDKRRFTVLAESENDIEAEEYSVRLLRDIHGILVASKRKAMATVDLIEQLRAIPTAPWRTFRGEGVTAHNMGDLLSTFQGVRRTTFRDGTRTMKGYRLIDVASAVEAHRKAIHDLNRLM